MNQHLKKRLAELNVGFKLHVHSSFPQLINSPCDMAKARGISVKRITKTGYWQAAGSNRDKFYLIVLSADERANLKIVAAVSGVTHLSLASRADLEQLFSRPEIAIPLACGNIPVFMDSSLLQYETILVGAGVHGEEIEIAPAAAVKMSGATVLDLTSATPVARASSDLILPEEVQSAFGPKRQL